jgi:hypothetical protein
MMPTRARARYRSRPVAGRGTGSRRACPRVAGRITFTSQPGDLAPATSSISRRTLRPMRAGAISLPFGRDHGRDRRAYRARSDSRVIPGCRRASPPLPFSGVVLSGQGLVFGRAVERATRPSATVGARIAKPLPKPFATLLGAFGCRSCRCATSAELAKSRSTAVSSPRRPLPIRWRDSPSASARIGADHARAQLDARIGRRLCGAWIGSSPAISSALPPSHASLQPRVARRASYGRANSHHRRDWALRVLHGSALAQPRHSSAFLASRIRKHPFDQTHRPSR